MEKQSPWKNSYRKRRQFDTTFLIEEPSERYHAQRDKFLSSHQLADFRKCPVLYKKKKDGLIADQDRPAYKIGRAAHVMILEGKKVFYERYVVGGPINEKTGKPYGATTKAYIEWEARQNCYVITGAAYATVCGMNAGFNINLLASEMLDGGIPEGVIRTNCCGVLCQGRIDYFHPNEGIIDLKTCDDLTWFESDMKRYGYVYQLAFYRALVYSHAAMSVPVTVVAVEKKEPFRCGVWRISEEVLGLAEIENNRAIKELKLCQSKDEYPTGYEEARTFDII